MEQVEDRFVEYYDQTSKGDETIQRSKAIKESLLSLRQRMGLPIENLKVVDIGCAVGSQSIVWAKEGHQMFSIDINQGLVDIAKQRAQEQDVDIDFRIGSATELPWDDAIADVCILPELLEHVEDWQSCLNEVIRMAKPNATVYVSTSNVLCPKQYEFDLPGYSWYPGFIKKHLVKLSVTTKRHWVSHADYPAVHWFSYFQLKKYFSKHGFICKDMFDLIVESKQGGAKYWAAKLICSNPLFRLFGHMCIPYTLFVGVKK